MVNINICDYTPAILDNYDSNLKPKTRIRNLDWSYLNKIFKKEIIQEGSTLLILHKSLFGNYKLSEFDQELYHFIHLNGIKGKSLTDVLSENEITLIGDLEKDCD